MTQDKENQGEGGTEESYLTQPSFLFFLFFKKKFQFGKSWEGTRLPLLCLLLYNDVHVTLYSELYKYKLNNFYSKSMIKLKIKCRNIKKISKTIQIYNPLKINVLNVI